MNKQHKICIFILTFLLIITTSIISNGKEYSTGYFDTNIKNISNNLSIKTKSDISFFIMNEKSNKFFYTATYNSGFTKKIINKNNFCYLDNSKIINNLSNQKYYLNIKYGSQSLIYGDFIHHIKTPLFFDYHKKHNGISYTVNKDKQSLNYYTVKSENSTLINIILNPESSVIYLNKNNIIYDSEEVSLNILDNENNIINIFSLKKDVDYEVDYINGRLLLNPTIILLNDAEYNYEVQISYKVEGDFHSSNNGFVYKTKIYDSTQFKYFNIRNKDISFKNGVSLSYKPDRYNELIVEKIETEDIDLVKYVSFDNGQNYFKDNIGYDKTIKKGIKIKKKFNNYFSFSGHNYQTNIENDLIDNYKEEESFIKFNTNINNKIKTKTSYKNINNNLGHDIKEYIVNLKTFSNSSIDLQTTYEKEIDKSKDQTLDSLNNFIYLELSENLDISWGNLHNLTNNMYYNQYGINYVINKSSSLSYNNKVRDLESREKCLKYKISKKIKLFNNNIFSLKDKHLIKKSSGLNYILNRNNSLSIINNKYYQDEKIKENIINLNKKLNSKYNISLSYFDYTDEVAGLIKNKTKTIMGVRYLDKNIKFKCFFENVLDNYNNKLKERIDINYLMKIKNCFILSVEYNDLKDFEKIEGLIFDKEIGFNLKYRPLSNNYIISYSLDRINNDYLEDDLKTEIISYYDSLKTSYHFNNDFVVNAVLSKLINTEKNNDKYYNNILYLNRISLSKNIYKDYYTEIEYRSLYDKSINDFNDGYLLSVKKELNENLSIGLDYNFTDFNNNLKNLSYDNKGLSLNINYIW